MKKLKLLFGIIVLLLYSYLERLFYYLINFKKHKQHESLNWEIAVITGGNIGIGYSTAKKLKELTSSI